ncbi:hypothetical protein GUJ93_ZPchr0002g24040 [Zizania palustris]|uniref:Uncharacterized protein n=1 Tax=Zizania palustris TaxID=103762 RepID=A0A8J5S258_ZIZPA|nr:hypothetical protein GUJ93_ZPchr0002g24040 [Zizania palustris]
MRADTTTRRAAMAMRKRRVRVALGVSALQDLARRLVGSHRNNKPESPKYHSKQNKSKCDKGQNSIFLLAIRPPVCRIHTSRKPGRSIPTAILGRRAKRWPNRRVVPRS